MKNISEKIFDYSGIFNGVFSLRPLINFWEREIAHNKASKASYNYISEKLKDAPELTKPITDFSLIEKHRELIDELLSICISPGMNKFEYYSAVFLDRLESFFETPAFRRLHLFENQLNSSCFNDNCCITPDGRIVSAYSTLLNLFYGINVSYEYPIIYTYYDEKTMLERYFRIRILGWFLDIKANKELKPLTETDRKRLIENIDNPKVLIEIVPPDQFEMEGFLIYNAVEITDQESISSLKFDLIGKESLLSFSKFQNLQHKLRILLRKPDIRLGLIGFPSCKKDFKNAIKMGNSLILDDSFVEKNIAEECTLYSGVLEKRESKIIYDIKDHSCSPKVEKEFINAGIRNLLIAPLIYKDEIIGMMELASSVPGDLNKVNTMKLNDVYPLFAVCLESGLDDLNKSIQSVIKEKCTAIHPSVDWRFRNAAHNYLSKLRNDIVEEMEDIVFENVYPFYGCSDAKDSSLHRNSAIQSDLIENFEMAKDIILKATSENAMPVLEELSFRIERQIEILKQGLGSSTEISAIDFIRTEISTTFEHLKELSPELKNIVTGYREKLDKKLGILTKKRKEFEESLTIINETVSAELEIQQSKAQKIFPHYFEKYKTDGIEYNMYLGESLIADRKYNPMYLKSLRLWQLVTMSIIAKRCFELKDKLSVPLDMTHLIFVQNNPITIKFFYDEKKFDVSGSYDIRYEIIKKRIDKAEIKGCKERLVSPGKIAIVYSQESEAEEYRQYISFLRTKNYITGEIETLELEDMQGVHGLKALRISVDSNFVIENSSEKSLLESAKSN